jgi:hypothetical protein
MKNSIKKFEDFEYRKGSTKYGETISKIMEWLRIYKTEQKINKITVNKTKFLKDINITIEQLIDLQQNGKKLYNFTITITDDKIILSDLNLTKKQGLPWTESTIIKFEDFL